MLKKLHWNLLPVWSIEYLDNPEGVIDKIVGEIQKLADPPAAPPASAPVTISEPSPKPVFETLPPKNPYPHQVPYSLVNDLQDDYQGLPGDFMKIVSQEEPISYETLIERAKDIMGWKRATPRFLEMIDPLIRQGGFALEKCGGTVFYWKNIHEMDSSKTYRLDYIAAMKRLPAECSFIELSNLFADILDFEGSISIEDLVLSTCRALATKNTGAAVSYINKAIVWAGKTSRNGIFISNGIVSLKK